MRVIGIARNRLLAWSLAAFAGYVAIGFIIPGPVLSSATSLLLLVCGGVTFFRYAPDAWQILFRGKRGNRNDGSHLAAYGVALLSAGSCYVGLFGLIWMYSGQPPDWLGTGYSGFGRGMMAVGFALLFLSPDISHRGLRYPSGAWMVALAAIAIILVFFFGFRVGQQEIKLGLWDVVQCRQAGTCSTAGDGASPFARRLAGLSS